jgi:hypothetical protein
MNFGHVMERQSRPVARLRLLRPSADKGYEAVLREMVNTVGSKGKPGEHVRCIVSVNMLSEGWDVKSVTHILGLRAFGSPLLTEQIIGRGLRRTNYDVLNQPLDERPEGSEETVDAFGIPFVGFPVEKRKRPKTGAWDQKPIWIEPDGKKEQFCVKVPNVRSWAVGVVESLADLVRVQDLPQIRLNPKETPPDVHVRPVVGGAPEAVVEGMDMFGVGSRPGRSGPAPRRSRPKRPQGSSAIRNAVRSTGHSLRNSFKVIRRHGCPVCSTGPRGTSSPPRRVCPPAIPSTCASLPRGRGPRSPPSRIARLRAHRSIAG